MFDAKQLGKRIRALRIQKGVSQDRLAEGAGLNGKYLGEVERGNANISIFNLAKLADSLDLPLASLLDTEHEKNGEGLLLAEIQSMLEQASDEQIKLIYRIISAVIH